MSQVSGLTSTRDALHSILHPKSVVVIGANEAGVRLSAGSVRNLLRHGYDGQLYVVNPRRDEVFGVRSYPGVADLPEVPDTAIVVVGTTLVPEVLQSCADAGIPTATVITAGFDEGWAQESGRSAAARLRAVLAATGMRILGPNTAGLINLLDRYVPRASMNHPTDLVAGSAAIITQSGALSNILVNRASAAGVGVGLCVATGNQLDITLWDVAEHCLDHSEINVLLMVIEGFKDPGRFVEIARQARRVGKPIVVFKLGASDAGRKVVETHSGALAGSGPVQAAILDELGVVQVQRLDELWEVGSLFTTWGTPVVPLERICVVTPSGGDGAIAADEATVAGFVLPEPPAPTVDAVAALAPNVLASNPFDTQAAVVVSDPESLGQQVTVIVDAPTYDGVLLTLPVVASEEAVASLEPIFAGLARAQQPRIAVSTWTAGDATDACVRRSRATGFPVFEGSDRAVRAMRHYARHQEQRARPLPSLPALPIAAPAPAELATYWDSRTQLAAIGVPFNRATLTRSATEAVDAADEIGYPVTLKVSTRAATHKAEAGLVHMYLADRDAVAVAAAELAGHVGDPGRGEGIVVEQYLPSMLSVFLGGHRDPEFGPIVLAGLGGALAEAYGDIARASCPSPAATFERRLRSTTFGRFLAARPALQTPLLALVERLSQRFVDDPTIASFDVNPLLMQPDGHLIAVDARIERVVAP